MRQSLGAGGAARLSWIICGPPSSLCPCTVGMSGASGVSSGRPESTVTPLPRRTQPPSHTRPASTGFAGSLRTHATHADIHKFIFWHS